VLEAGLGFAVGRDKVDYVGRDAVIKAANDKGLFVIGVKL